MMAGRFHSPTLIAAALLAALCGQAAAQSETRDIDEVKAAFVLKFVKFVEWPEGAFESTDSPLRIGISGNRKLYDALSELTAGEESGGRKFEIVYSNDAKELGKCQIAYFGSDLEGALVTALHDLGNASVLTIGDSDEFTSSGGVIRLYEKSRKINMEINVSAAERAALKISSKLLELATVVRDKNA